MDKLKIFLTKGSGEGITENSAYCRALKKAGLINLNLIQLTSVLPYNSQIINKKPKFSYRDHGRRIYVIMSTAKTSKIGETICAGLGWIEEKNGSGQGLVIQLRENNEKKLKKNIKDSLKEIIRYGEAKYKKKLNIVTEKITCENKPVCAMVALVFDKIESWT